MVVHRQSDLTIHRGASKYFRSTVCLCRASVLITSNPYVFFLCVAHYRAAVECDITQGFWLGYSKLSSSISHFRGTSKSIVSVLKSAFWKVFFGSLRLECCGLGTWLIVLNFRVKGEGKLICLPLLSWYNLLEVQSSCYTGGVTWGFCLCIVFPGALPLNLSLPGPVYGSSFKLCILVLLLSSCRKHYGASLM